MVGAALIRALPPQPTRHWRPFVPDIQAFRSTCCGSRTSPVCIRALNAGSVIRYRPAPSHRTTQIAALWSRHADRIDQTADQTRDQIQWLAS